MKYILSILLVFSLLLFQNCTKKEIIIETEIVTVHDTLVVTVHDTLVVNDTVTINTIVNDTATYFFIVRHAEKGSGSNPSLTTAGQARADELARVLGGVHLDATFSTNYNRTKETAQPTATDQGVDVKIYNNNAQVKTTVLGNESYRNVLVVGHSNTAPGMANLLLGQNMFPDLGENDFDNLYIVAYYNDTKAEVFPLKYGN